MSERTYSTDRSTSAGRVYPFPARGTAELDARIKKVVITDDGKLGITLECDVADETVLEQVRGLLLAQRGPVSASFTSTQGELDL